MRYFHETMGRYFVTLTDHGGNATPVCSPCDSCPFTHPRSTGLLFATALLDPLLILLFSFVAAGPSVCARRSWPDRLRANDLYMFGTDWPGRRCQRLMAALGLASARSRCGAGTWAARCCLRGESALPGIAVLACWCRRSGGLRCTARRPRVAVAARDAARARRHGARVVVAAPAVASCGAVVGGAVASAWIGWARKPRADQRYHVNHVSFHASCRPITRPGRWRTTGRASGPGRAVRDRHRGLPC